MAPVTVINVGYRSTNYWVISAGTSRILVDLGWPGTFGQLQANLKRMDVPLGDLRYGLATHYHPDHAGLAQELKHAGVPLLVLDVQLSALAQLKQWTKPHERFVDITPHDTVTIAGSESRALLARIGIAGEIVATPGHSPDSISVLLDSGAVFTGDLPLPAMSTAEQAAEVHASWRVLRERGARQVYPGHGPVWQLDGTRGG